MKKKSRLVTAGIVLGVLLMCAPVLGAIGSAIGMVRAFGTLADRGIADPKALSKDIGWTLYSTATGVFLFPCGVVVLTISLVARSRRGVAGPPQLPSDG
jgi:biopolymer transport protein ExbB/TolQ